MLRVVLASAFLLGAVSVAGTPVPTVVGKSLAPAPQSRGQAAAAIDEPVVVKLVSPDVLHKSDVGGVRLGVSGGAAVRAAFDDVSAAGRAVPGARTEGVLIAPMLILLSAFVAWLVSGRPRSRKRVTAS